MELHLEQGQKKNKYKQLFILTTVRKYCGFFLFLYLQMLWQLFIHIISPLAFASVWFTRGARGSRVHVSRSTSFNSKYIARLLRLRKYKFRFWGHLSPLNLHITMQFLTRILNKLSILINSEIGSSEHVGFSHKRWFSAPGLSVFDLLWTKRHG
jgi:hypothetical protein